MHRKLISLKWHTVRQYNLLSYNAKNLLHIGVGFILMLLIINGFYAILS